ncbi:MAG: outer membrane beta-barrel protein [Micavibrio sp.]
MPALLCGGIALSGTVLFWAAAQAQTIDSAQNAKNMLSVTTRTNKLYDLDPRRIGDFTFITSLQTGMRYNDNIYAAQNGKRSDIAYQAAPSLALGSDFIRHAASFTMAMEKAWHARYAAENYTDFKTMADGRIDVTGQTSVPLRISFERGHYSRDEPEENITRKPSTYNLWTGLSGLTHQGARFSFKSLATIKKYLFTSNEDKSGVKINDDRDRRETGFYASLGLRDDVRIAPFFYSSILDISYDEKRNTARLLRDSKTYELGAGTIVNLSGVTRLSFHAGKLHRDMKDPTLNDVDDVAYGAAAQWEPSTLMALTFSADRTAQETITAGAFSRLADTIGLSLQYELFPNVLLTPAFTYKNFDYQGINRETEQYNASFGATYKMNQNLWLSGNYHYITQEDKGTDAAGNTFESNIINLSLKLQF